MPNDCIVWLTVEKLVFNNLCTIIRIKVKVSMNFNHANDLIDLLYFTFILLNLNIFLKIIDISLLYIYTTIYVLHIVYWKTFISKMSHHGYKSIDETENDCQYFSFVLPLIITSCMRKVLICISLSS